MYAHPEQKKNQNNILELLSLGTLLLQLVCSGAHVSAGFMIKFWLRSDEYLPPGALWQTAAFDCVWVFFFPRLTSIPFEAWTNRNNGLWWADQRPCSRASPSGACPRRDTHSLPPAFISTMDRRPRGLHVRSFYPQLEKPPKSRWLPDISAQLTSRDW